MRMLKAIGTGLKNFFILFSFIVNLVLVVIILALVFMIFDIKNNIVTPLVSGLHSSFVGLDEATIDWTIPVRDSIPVVMDIPLQTETTVVLTENVPLFVNANITLPGGGGNLSATVNLTLPQGLELPVALDLNVPVDEQLDVSLDVRAVIPIADTQLHDPIENLRLTFEPIARALYNLPDGLGDTISLIGEALAGRANLLAANAYSEDPWPGYSQTAGVGYTLAGEPVPIANQPLVTGIVPLGGIPAMDQVLRPELYENNANPQAANEAAIAHLDALGISRRAYDGSYAEGQPVEVEQPNTEPPTDPSGSAQLPPTVVPTAIVIPETGEGAGS